MGMAPPRALEAAKIARKGSQMFSNPSTRVLDLTPMTLDEARALLRQLLGSYPSAGATDPEVYVASLISLLTGYPLWAGQRAIEKTIDTSKFLPTRADLKPLIEDEVRVHRYAAEWDRHAEAQIAAQAVPLIAGPPPKPRPTYDELKEKYGPNWGLKGAEVDRAAKQAQLAQIQRANQVIIDRAHSAAGTTRAPPLSASPLLAARIAEQDATRAAIPPEPGETKPAYDGGRHMQRIGGLAKNIVEGSRHEEPAP